MANLIEQLRSGDVVLTRVYDELTKARDAVIMRRLKPAQHASYEALIVGGGDALGSHERLRKYAADWQDRLDAEVK